MPIRREVQLPCYEPTAAASSSRRALTQEQLQAALSGLQEGLQGVRTCAGRELLHAAASATRPRLPG